MGLEPVDEARPLRSEGVCRHGRVVTLCPTCRAELRTKLGKPSMEPAARIAARMDLPAFRPKIQFEPYTPRAPQALVVPIRFEDTAEGLSQKHGIPHTRWEQIQPCFPKEAPRFGQDLALQLAFAGLEQFDDVIIEAPTGLGKSSMAKALANHAEAAGHQSFLVVHRNGLLDQYHQEYRDLALVKGMRNYPCVRNRRTGCDRGDCQTRSRFQCPELDECHYFGPHGARERAQGASQALTNYDYLYWAAVANEQFPQRGLLVLDEAHRLEDSLMGNIKVRLSDAAIQGFCGKTGPQRVLEKLSAAPEPEEQTKILENLHQHVQAALEDLGPLASVAPAEKQRFLGFLSQLEFVVLELRHRPKNWVRHVEPARPPMTTGPTLEYKPITIAPYAKSLLRLGAKRVHLSATILDHVVYLRALGIERALVLKVLDSPFPAGNRPVHNLALARLKKDNLDAELPRIHAAIDEILAHHADEKGIILPFTHRIRQSILTANLQGRARLITHSEDADERSAVIEGFLQDKTSNRVLVSTYAGEGMDFLGDIARFAIIVKCPYPNLGDEQVAARMREDPRWYDNEALKTIIQMAGRVCRSPTDHGSTYILDENADLLLRRNRAIVPPWFWEAYRRGNPLLRAA